MPPVLTCGVKLLDGLYLRDHLPTHLLVHAGQGRLRRCLLLWRVEVDARPANDQKNNAENIACVSQSSAMPP